MNIEMALKSRSYILDLDCVKLSLEFFFSELFNWDFLADPGKARGCSINSLVID